MLVEPDAPVVAPEFVGHDPVRLGIPATSGDVDGLVVEEDPDLGLLGGRRPFEGFGLDEIADSWNPVVDRLVEASVEVERLFESNGADGGATEVVAPDHRRGVGRRRTVDHGSRRRLLLLSAGGVP
ncbi:MAG: hypothetical protein F4174_01360 [Acidobacteria bacterium]|nr:hypothetical protein [Acidobacteriota bacterium]